MVPFVNADFTDGSRMSTAPTPSAPPLTAPDRRPLRADARRNRERIVAAAQAEFAVSGGDAQMDTIAARAGVGVGTVYRHFPTKEALVSALLVDSFERITEHAHAALDEPDPWAAFSGTMWFGAELLAANRGLTESMVMLPADAGQGPDAALRETTQRLIARAQAAGVLRGDLVIDDIPMLMCGIGAATRKPHQSRESWRRHLGILLDGLRAPAATSVLPD